MRILILGISGMLGNAVWKHFVQHGEHEVFGTIRNDSLRQYFPSHQQNIYSNVNVLDQDQLVSVLASTRANIVINCIGLIKQLSIVNDPIAVLPINSILPHRLANLTALTNTKLIHISTDCVFSGSKGGYIESDMSDAEDLYGKSKYIGEVHNATSAITLRTSIIGHELSTNYSLVDWFLSQNNQVKGFTKAIFSGLPTVELARVIHDYVIPNLHLHGLFHVSANPISKFDLLHLIAKTYKKNIQINPDDNVIVNRSLNSNLFTSATGYLAPEWPKLIETMYLQAESKYV